MATGLFAAIVLCVILAALCARMYAQKTRLYFALERAKGEALSETAAAEKFKSLFENISNRILREQRGEFSKEQAGAVAPIAQQLADFRAIVDSAKTQAAEDKARLAS